MIGIETDRLLLRPMQPGDVEALALLWTDAEVTRYLGGPREFRTLREIFAARAGLSTAYDLWPVVEKASGQLVGQCGLVDKEVEGEAVVELVYVFARAAWGKGYATEAAAAVRDYALRRLALPRIVALIHPENGASERVAGKLGMRYEKDTKRPDGKTLRLYVYPKPSEPG